MAQSSKRIAHSFLPSAVSIVACCVCHVPAPDTQQECPFCHSSSQSRWCSGNYCNPSTDTAGACAASLTYSAHVASHCLTLPRPLPEHWHGHHQHGQTSTVLIQDVLCKVWQVAASNALTGQVQIQPDRQASACSNALQVLVTGSESISVFRDILTFGRW